jgi:rubrerythrin
MEMQVVKELILQSLEHEMGGVKIYEAALKCVRNAD